MTSKAVAAAKLGIVGAGAVAVGLAFVAAYTAYLIVAGVTHAYAQLRGWAK